MCDARRGGGRHSEGWTGIRDASKTRCKWQREGTSEGCKCSTGQQEDEKDQEVRQECLPGWHKLVDGRVRGFSICEPMIARQSQKVSRCDERELDFGRWPTNPKQFSAGGRPLV
jgi:hypothetical protein